VAGGFSPRGYQYGVDVTRTINGVPTTASVPMTFPIRPGDTVTVRERFF
jgi:polysaccharide export outer membrane protein